MIFIPDDSLSIKSHNIIEDCCLACNEKNIFRAIKTDDKELFNKCLKDVNKISIPKDKLSFLSSGKSNFYTFGFNTRRVGLSRGNKLGNNAFVISGSYNEDFSTGYEQIIRKFISYSK